MNLILSAIQYVTNDPFFWPSMGVTVAIGVFIGSVIYDGVLSDLKKMIVSLLCYVTLISIVNLCRIIPDLKIVATSKPLGSIITIILVTVFYLMGTYWGVLITKKAHKGVE